MRNSVTYIYILKCPEIDAVKYVGKSNDPKCRYYEKVLVGIYGKERNKEWDF